MIVKAASMSTAIKVILLATSRYTSAPLLFRSTISQPKPAVFEATEASSAPRADEEISPVTVPAPIPVRARPPTSARRPFFKPILTPRSFFLNRTMKKVLTIHPGC